MVNNKQKIETLEQIIKEYELKLEILKQELRYLKLKIQKAFSIPQDTHFEKSLANALVFNWFM